MSVSSPVSPPWTRSRHGKRVTADGAVARPLSQPFENRGKPRASNIMARPIGPGPVLLGFPPAALSPPGPLGLGMGPGPPTAGWVWRERHPPRVDKFKFPFYGARQGPVRSLFSLEHRPPPRHRHRGSNADMMGECRVCVLVAGGGNPPFPLREREGCSLSRSHGYYVRELHIYIYEFVVQALPDVI